MTSPCKPAYSSQLDIHRDVLACFSAIVPEYRARLDYAVQIWEVAT
jgi:hypothetical protein